MSSDLPRLVGTDSSVPPLSFIFSLSLHKSNTFVRAVCSCSCEKWLFPACLADFALPAKLHYQWPFVISLGRLMQRNAVQTQMAIYQLSTTAAVALQHCKPPVPPIRVVAVLMPPRKLASTLGPTRLIDTLSLLNSPLLHLNISPFLSPPLFNPPPWFQSYNWKTVVR